MTETSNLYRVLHDDLRVGSALIGEYPHLPIEVSWFAGRRIEQPLPKPLVFRVLKESGTWMSAFFGAGIPLMRNDLIAALQKAGVDNLDCYEARIEDPRTGTAYSDYRAVNVIGVVAAADMELSHYDRGNASRLIDVDFDGLTIKGMPIPGLLFRLAECVSAIIVHDQVRQCVEPLQLPGVAFLQPANWIG